MREGKLRTNRLIATVRWILYACGLSIGMYSAMVLVIFMRSIVTAGPVAVWQALDLAEKHRIELSIFGRLSQYFIFPLYVVLTAIMCIVYARKAYNGKKLIITSFCYVIANVANAYYVYQITGKFEYTVQFFIQPVVMLVGGIIYCFYNSNTRTDTGDG